MLLMNLLLLPLNSLFACLQIHLLLPSLPSLSSSPLLIYLLLSVRHPTSAFYEPSPPSSQFIIRVSPLPRLSSSMISSISRSCSSSPLLVCVLFSLTTLLSYSTSAVNEPSPPFLAPLPSSLAFPNIGPPLSSLPHFCFLRTFSSLLSIHYSCVS